QHHHGAEEHQLGGRVRGALGRAPSSIRESLPQIRRVDSKHEWQWDFICQFGRLGELSAGESEANRLAWHQSLVYAMAALHCDVERKVGRCGYYVRDRI